MEHQPNSGLLDSNGQPLDARIERALSRLLPRLRRQFSVLQDDVTLTEIMEEAGRRIAKHEEHDGPLEKLNGYAWVTLRSVATSRMRLGASRLMHHTLDPEESRSRLVRVQAATGTPEEIERQILLKEALALLSPDERRICLRKAAGFSSQEIAVRDGRTANAVDTLFSRAKDKIRRALGVQLVQTQRGDSIAPPTDGESAPQSFDEDHTETDDGTPGSATRRQGH